MGTSPELQRLRLLLKSLSYAKAQSFDPLYVPAYRELVVWLESMKIRQYKPEERKALADVGSTSWDAQAYAPYLQELACPVPFNKGSYTSILEWLLALAVHLDYSDDADKFTPKPAAEEPPCTSSWANKNTAERSAQPPSSSGPFADLSSPEVLSGLHELCKLLRVDPGAAHGGSLADALQEAQERLCQEVLPAMSAQRQGVRVVAQPQALDSLPLGFDAQGDALRRAAAVLRLLYIQDLRRLQTHIDQSIVEMQEYTANPKTDAGLGRVGR